MNYNKNSVQASIKNLSAKTSASANVLLSKKATISLTPKLSRTKSIAEKIFRQKRKVLAGIRYP